jgi:hypothetical protein
MPRPPLSLLPQITSKVVVDDPAALQVTEEDVLRLGLAGLGAGLDVADAGSQSTAHVFLAPRQK